MTFKLISAQRRSSSIAGAKGSSRGAVEPRLKVLPISVWSPSAQNAMPSPPRRGDTGSDCFGSEGGGGVRTRYLPMWSSLLGLFLLSFETLISRRWKLCELRRLWPYRFREPSRYVRAHSFTRLVLVLMLYVNFFLFLGRQLLT